MNLKEAPVGRGQAASETQNSGEGRSDFDAGEMAVTRSIATANHTLRAPTQLLPSLISASYAFRARRWWKRSPFLPLPDSEYTRWRLYTAYGNKRQRPSFGDIATFAVWRQSIRRVVEMRSQ
ncbi:MAG: hypothetical protein ACRDVK_01815 [Acidimicrobiia bacterium]